MPPHPGPSILNLSKGAESLIRASDIGLYVFCARAWRLKAEGYESANLGEMAAGRSAHRAHGEAVAAYQRARQWSRALFALALVALVLWLLAR
ncbi:MAG: hypothetical protein HY259_00955 [Chloroflexi bacterium]|nr:hypothetical protein [Chloroflexota bacterium]MBI3732016.1 hypothetical protein [Chloroflexota bacterium]